MITDQDHAELEGLVAAVALGAADAADAAAVASHLETCPGCRELAGRLARAVTGLPMAVEVVEPPPSLRARILAAAAAAPATGAAPPVMARRRPPRVTRTVSPGWWRPLAVAAAAVIAFGLGAGVGFGLGAGRGGPEGGQAVAQYVMTGSGPLAGAHGRVYELRRDGLTLIQFSGLSQPAAGHVYEVWLISPGGQAQAGGVFVPGADGSQVVVLGRGLAGVKTLAVTEEAGPAGVTAPTQQPQLVGSV
ncbi:MAG TPA: anti-sigma factor [Candidatus Dormibacteraeota bacterium]